MTELYSTENLVKALMNKFDLGFDEFDQSKGITVEALCFYCMQEIMNGNAQKHIQISMDDEGNAYHTLFYGFAPDIMEYANENFHDDVNLNDCVILG